MRLTGGKHLAYCTNIHRGETWGETLANLERHTLAVRTQVCPDAPYAIGLRLGAAAARELAEPSTLTAFRRWLDHHNAYVFTINGFPYGTFHGTRVKEQVYAPDWQTRERVEYTLRLADLIAEWVPAGVEGSISTVPGSFEPWMQAPAQGETIARHVAEVALRMHEITRDRGTELHLGLEPEPACWLETTDEFLHFYQNQLIPVGSAWLSAQSGMGRDEAEAVIRRHVGINFDCCHLAIQYESLADSLARLMGAGVKISKIHLSAA
ncbi:MAG: metabolite traffic protein EboE, partial [Verrucomicrobiae bacterium]|nr:metabolite traffic protein EboE [Verrucomicrobiae bacterium]